MTTEHEVIDNFLQPKDFEKIQNLFMPKYEDEGATNIAIEGDGIKSTITTEFPFIPWTYNVVIARADEPKNWKTFYMSHLVYFDTLGIVSPFYPFFEPILDLLDVKALRRIKCNLFPYTEIVQEHSLHADADFSHKTALFSINTCDGYTTLENGTRVGAVANRMLKFDGSSMHKSSTTSDQTVRINVNFNYF